MADRSTRHVRVVSPGEKAEPEKVKTLSEAIEAGVYLDILLAQRREIVKSLPDEKGPAKAALHRQLSLISKEIASLQLTEEADRPAASNAHVDNSYDASAI